MVVRPDLILDVVREAAASGHRNLLVLPGGFAEGGEEGQARDRALRELAQAQGLTIAGPNCAGLIDLLDRANPCASTFFRDMPRGGGVALISQSGAIAEEVIGSSRSLAFRWAPSSRWATPCSSASPSTWSISAPTPRAVPSCSMSNPSATRSAFAHSRGGSPRKSPS